MRFVCLYILVLFFSNISYSDVIYKIEFHQTSDTNITKPKLRFRHTQLKDSFWSQKNIQEKWKILSDSIGGCLVGDEYNYSNHSDACFNKNVYWNDFLSKSDTQLVDFLIDKLKSNKKSNVHVCPYFVATQGELATYCLQQLSKVSWYDLDKSFQKYVDGTLVMKKDYYSLQEVLQNLLKKKSSRELMMLKWRKLFGV